MIFGNFGAAAPAGQPDISTVISTVTKNAVMNSTTLTPAQKAVKIAEIDAAEAKARAAYAAAGVPVPTALPGAASTPAITTASMIPSSFYDEHSTAIKVGLGLALAGAVGVVLWKRRGSSGRRY